MVLSIKNTNYTKMFENIRFILLTVMLLLAGVAGFVLVAKPKAQTKLEDNSLELSLNGEVRSYPFPSGSIIHVIADENQNLIDIQVFPVGSSASSIKPTNTTWQTNNHAN